ncbi:Factor VIII intron 22 protein [Operophtera brumata]|uniref:Factor VIII intron 22 protein n=1 Tax=Operophtera brumata TaxID=104452 RepID=A0A0L7KNJ5_OPEBR|nr:Factor VIII intron 22 protein [Operophtera brumata]
MSTDLDSNFNEQFMSINMKLKRRFMRKPNMSECAKEFIALAVRCEYSEQPTFAGHAYVGAAKCEATAGNSLEEADHYVTAAKQFMKAEKKLHSMKFFSPNRENLEAAIGCYLTAFHKYPEQTLICGSILMRLSSDLVALGHKEEALAYYAQAIHHVKENNMKQICLKNKIDLEIECVIPFDPDLKLHLQSVISTALSGDVQALVATAADTLCYLTRQQEDLLHTLISRERAQHLALS